MDNLYIMETSMKKIKRLFVNLIAVVLTCAVCLSASACKMDIRKIKLEISVYNYEEGVTEVVAITIDLYRHIAPATVDAILGYVKEGYYNNALFYKMSGYANQIMVGDLKVDGDNIVNNAIKPQLPSEFSKGGRVNSNLSNTEGAIGLWRSWYAWNNNSYDQANASMQSGRATWYMPTSTISSYNDWFCVFALVDLTNTDNSEAFELIKNAFSNEQVQTYTVYYTGEYDAQSPDKNDGYGLDFNCVKGTEVEDENVFEAVKDDSSKQELVCFNKHQITVPVVSSGFSAYIKTAVAL